MCLYSIRVLVLTYINLGYKSIFGQIVSHWKHGAQRLLMDINKCSLESGISTILNIHNKVDGICRKG